MFVTLRNVVEFETVFEDREGVYIIMKRAEKGSLGELLRKRKRLSEPEIAVFGLQILEGLQYINEKNIIHRDLKLGI